MVRQWNGVCILIKYGNGSYNMSGGYSQSASLLAHNLITALRHEVILLNLKNQIPTFRLQFPPDDPFHAG